LGRKAWPCGCIVLIFKIFFFAIKVYYDERSVAKYTIKLIKLIDKNGVFNPIHFTFNKRDKYGRALIYSTLQDLSYLTSYICECVNPKEVDTVKNMTKTYISSYIFNQIVFIKMVEAEIVSLGYTDNWIYLIKNKFNEYILNYYYNQAFSIKTLLCFLETLRSFLKPYYYFLLVLKRVVLSVLIGRSNKVCAKPALWVEYTHRDVVDFLFWKGHVNSDDFDIVYYLDRTDTPAEKEVIEEIDKQNVKWIDAHIIPLLNYADFGWEHLRKMLSGLYSYKLDQPYWYRAFWVEYLFWYILYVSAFRYYKVKLLIQHNDTSWKQEIIARALEDAGGILIGFNWSNYPMRLTPTHLFPFHVLFLWGDVIKDFVTQGEHTCRYVLPSGIWLKGKENKNNMKLFSPDKIDFVITIFDSSVAYNIYQTPDDLSRFFLRIFELVENNRRWSAVVKGKNSGETNYLELPGGTLILSKAKKLKKEGRLIMLDSAISPVEASNYGELSVCFGLNSAGIISAVYGNSVVMWDCSGWTEHPFYTDSSQKFLYQDIDTFIRAIISFAEGDKTIGDFSLWRKRFNYFNDFNAPKRVGEFIQDFMMAIKDDDEVEVTLSKCVERYCVKNCLNKNKMNDNTSNWRIE